MFYNTEILTSRKGGLAVFWLAATVGSRGGTAVRKLSKKELLSCNVVKACEKVIEPEEPLALRLSSNLMMGIARVFSQQYTIYASDVQQVHAALKKVVSDAVASAPDTTLAFQDAAQWDALPQQAAAAVAKEATGSGGINLTVNAGLSYIGYDPDIDLGIEWRLPGEEEPEQVEDIDEPPLITPDISNYGSPAPKQRKAHQAREEDIKLHEPHLDDYLLKQAEQDVDLGGEDLGFVFEEGEQGLLEGISPELDAVIRAGSAASGRGSARDSHQGDYGMPASSSAVGMGEDMGGFDQQYFDQDFGGGFGEEEQRMDVDAGLDTEARVRQEVEDARARLDAFFGGFSRSVTPFDSEKFSQRSQQLEDGPPSSTTQRRIADAVSEAQNKAAEAKKAAQKLKKPKRLAIDRNIDMEGDRVRDARRTYGERMRVEREKAERVKNERAAHERAVSLVFGPPALLSAPGLAAFWNSEVVDKMAPFEGNKALAEKKRLDRKQAAKKVADKDGTAEPEDARRGAGDRLSEQPEGAVAGQPFEADFGADFFAHQEFGGGFGGEGDMGGFDQIYFDEFQEVELGRAASATGRSGSHRASAVPWAAEPATSDVGGPFGGNFGGASSGGGGSKVSLEPGVERPMRSRSPSLLPSPGRGGSAGGLEDEVDAAASGVRASQSPRASGLAMEEPALAENESNKFLGYARKQAASLPAGQPLYFSNIVPEKTTAPAVAAQALYHLLGLAMKGAVKVEQPIAFGEIAIELK